jgi:hypothetical protein
MSLELSALQIPEPVRQRVIELVDRSVVRFSKPCKHLRRHCRDSLDAIGEQPVENDIGSAGAFVERRPAPWLQLNAGAHRTTGDAMSLFLAPVDG